jgi:hypothetical protein
LIPRREQRPTYGIVSYINTDLNNFGKKNDMRESVKNLRRHFTQEIKERFGIPFNGVPSGDHRGDCLNHNLQEELNGVLGRILHGAGGAGPTFKIEHCRLDGKKLHLGAKHPNGETLSLDFMSAGENECFFIFLLLLGMNIKNSIILLDEPDLHMNHSAKEVFFRELLDRLQKEDCQVVLSTHSMDAYTRGASMDRQMIRLDRDAKGEVLYTCDWKDIYDVEFQDRAWRTSIRSLRRLGLVSGLRLARREIFLLYDEWFRRFDPRTSAGILERMTFIAQRAGAVIGVLLLVILTICGLIAFGWDALTVVDHAFASEHTDKLWPIHRFCVLLSIGLVGWYHLRLWWRADRARTSA